MRPVISPNPGVLNPGRQLVLAVLVMLITFLLFWQAPALAATSVELELVDGTVIHGTLNSFADGVYTINSDTLGTLRIEAAKVKSLRSAGAPAASPDDLQSLQSKIESNAAVMDLVKSLQQDPDFQAILSDKEIMEAITSGDLHSLESNPKVQKILNKSTLRDIEQKLRQGQ